MKLNPFFYLIAIFSLSSSFLFSQDLTFSDLADIPIPKSAIASANDGSNIFVANGFSQNDLFTNEIFKYNSFADFWSILTISDVPKRYVSCGLIGEYLYVFNGESINGIMNSKVEKINITDGSISYMTENPQPCRSAGFATCNDKIYSFGGNLGSNEYSNLLYEFDPILDTWVVLSQIPFTGETKGEIIDGKLYVIGGFNGNVSDRIDIYDIQSNSWDDPIIMPYGISAHSTTIVGSKIYIIGDFSNLSSVCYFETSDRTFKVLENNMIGRRHSAVENINESIYVIGGNTESNIQSALSSVQKVDVVSSFTENHNLEDLIVFPNPTSDIIYFGQKLIEASIYNIQGQKVSEIRNADSHDISFLPKGTYFVSAKINNEIINSKFVK